MSDEVWKFEFKIEQKEGGGHPCRLFGQILLDYGTH